ncbi:MAG TPA: hypothetical protein VK524_12245, partial [Polyangiaceae bacterium]|nr:hypothetical protein [Polyangiaceae bacterium]
PSSPDFDFGLGVARRSYRHDTPGGTLGDYRLSTPVVCARVGVSDRAFEPVGVRVGARLSLGWDMRRHQRSYTSELTRSTPGEAPEGASTVVRSSRQVGGVTVVLTMTLALDVAP